jgi:hypothetical protein
MVAVVANPLVDAIHAKTTISSMTLDVIKICVLPRLSTLPITNLAKTVAKTVYHVYQHLSAISVKKE